MALATALAGALPGPSAWAQDRLTDPSESCPVAAPAWMSGTEAAAWALICAGQPADMSRIAGTDDGAGCDPAQSDNWPDSRILSARFLRAVTARAPFTEVPAAPAVRISCAHVPDGLTLAAETIPQALWLTQSRVSGPVDLTDARIGADLILIDLRVDGPLGAAGARVEGDFYLSGAAAELLWLDGLTVTGTLGAAGLTLTGDLALEGARIGGNLLIRDGSRMNAIRAPAMQVAANLEITDTVVTQNLNAQKVRVGGSLALNASRFAEASLLSAEITGTVEMIGVDVAGTLALDSLSTPDAMFLNASRIGNLRTLSTRIGGALEMTGIDIAELWVGDALQVGGSLSAFAGTRLPETYLPQARIGGTLYLNGAEMTGLVNLTGAEMGDLTLWLGGTEPVWGPDSALVLRNARALALQARMPESWTRADGTALQRDLQGFRYDRLGGLGSGAVHDLGRVDALALIDWIEGPGLDPTLQGQAPGPYRQMETVLRNMGAAAAADRVALARHQQRMASHPATLAGWWAWTRDLAWGAFIGFGIYPFRVLWWFAGLIAAGTLIARLNPQLRARGWADGFWYSVQNAFPLIELSRDHKDITHPDARIRSFFHFQKVAGFILATILLAAFTILGA